MKNKVINKFGYFGFLGLLGLLGLITDSKAFFGFFGFFYYLRFFSVIPDELFKANIQKAATPAFFVGIFIYAVTFALAAFSISTRILIYGFTAGFAVPVLIFTNILISSEIKEKENRSN